MKRRGVSPVVATLLLIVIAVAAAVLAYVWVTGYMGTLAPRETPTSMRERVKIDAAKVDTGSVTIYVSNIGEVDTTVISAYILYSNYTVVCSNTAANVDIPKETVRSVTITGCSLTPGTTYIAKVSTKGGAEATYIFTRG